jgi:hypothetical protein
LKKGGKCVENDSTPHYCGTKYAVGGVEIWICYEFYSYELYFRFGFDGYAGGFELEEIFRLMQKKNPVSRAYQVTNKGVLDKCMEKISPTIQEAVSFLLLNPDSRSALGKQRLLLKNELILRRQLEMTLQKAERMWLTKQFPEFVRLLSPIQNKLGKIEAARFEYAKKKIRQQQNKEP